MSTKVCSNGSQERRDEMQKKELYDVMAEMKELMGAESLLEELFQAMSSDEAQENLEHIDRMHDLGLFPDEDEESEDEDED